MFIALTSLLRATQPKVHLDPVTRLASSLVIADGGSGHSHTAGSRRGRWGVSGPALRRRPPAPPAASRGWWTSSTRASTGSAVVPSWTRCHRWSWNTNRHTHL